ncbi:hypothetical protein MPL1032_180331 [Mesorhizobium plurifarium]|uniref:Uncharacterized protein n=1 Tax=Mesorhizobium plurifarium TaxID=69974 RepID=A0A0K2VV27_MESPL|nr:hypothetical protein MPL1032_180331 [Mesorhizobium plurifarium]
MPTGYTAWAFHACMEGLAACAPKRVPTFGGHALGWVDAALCVCDDVGILAGGDRRRHVAVLGAGGVAAATRRYGRGRIIARHHEAAGLQALLPCGAGVEHILFSPDRPAGERDRWRDPKFRTLRSCDGRACNKAHLPRNGTAPAPALLHRLKSARAGG